MFNHELKEAFIKDYTAGIKYRETCVLTFDIFEKYEKEWNADLCTRTEKDLAPIVNEIVGIRDSGRSVRFTILKSYVKWCISHNVPGACDGMLRVKPDVVSKMKIQTVTSPLHLQRYLDCIFEPEDDDTVDNVFRCFFWFAYGGVPEDDTISIVSSNIDWRNMVVRYKDSEYPIYREAIRALEKCSTLTHFQFKHPNYTYSKKVYRARIEGDKILRGIRSDPTLRHIRMSVSKKQRKALDEHRTQLKLSYYRVWLSGLFYRMYEREIAGFPVDFLYAAIEFTSGKTYTLSNGYTKEGLVRRIAETYRKDYEKWKLTFT